ncbi:MAG: PHP domain-containing protein [Deferrisomatales bacterium]|nr:PHP domain-containing protein [Deferrisomatales bacterium]
MKIRADLHVHTVASGHAFSTVEEIAREAAARKLRAVGISDHGPALPGGPHINYFRALRFLPPFLRGVRLLKGVEANLLDRKGRLDLPPELLEQLDYVMVGFHEGCGLKPSTTAGNTGALVAAMQRPGVRVLTHPGNPGFPVDISALAQAACELGVALEINNSSFGRSPTRQGSLERCSALAAAVARVGGPIALSSDAHVAGQVGEVHDAWRVASAAGIRPEQVVNRTYSGLMRFLGLDAEDAAEAPVP